MGLPKDYDRISRFRLLASNLYPARPGFGAIVFERIPDQERENIQNTPDGDPERLE